MSQNRAKRMQRCRPKPPTEKKLSDGPPIIYQLPTKQVTMDKTRQIAKFSVYKSNPFKGGSYISRGVPEKVLMLVGATGAGKTTLINGMANYIFGVRWEDEYRLKLIIEEGERLQAHSQTNWISAYKFPKIAGSSIPYKLTIIDTPGFGDTEGIERDRSITNQIKEFFSLPGKKGIKHLDGIGFVVQASLPRLTPTQKYIFDSILAIFGKDIGKNIFIMVTFADGNKPPVMEAINSAEISFLKSYTFNNSAFYVEPDQNKFSEMFWVMGYESFEDFFNEFGRVESRSLQLTKEVLGERQKLEVTVEGLLQKVNIGLSKVDVLRQEEIILKTREAEIASNQDFKYVVKIKKEQMVDNSPGKYVTNCLTCNFTCHNNCVYNNDEDKFKCSAMDGSKDSSTAVCRICPMRCHWMKHFNRPYRFERIEVEEERTLEDLKKRYDEAVSGKSKQESMISNLEDNLEFIYDKILEMTLEINKSLNRLGEIALKPNPLTEVQYIELLIESEKQEAKPGFQQRIHYLGEVKKRAELMSKAKEMQMQEKKEFVEKREKRWWEKIIARFW